MSCTNILKHEGEHNMGIATHVQQHLQVEVIT
jgi:hypothetical protein